jgi:hypothetical protein
MNEAKHTDEWVNSSVCFGKLVRMSEKVMMDEALKGQFIEKWGVEGAWKLWRRMDVQIFYDDGTLFHDKFLWISMMEVEWKDEMKGDLKDKITEIRLNGYICGNHTFVNEPLFTIG